MPARLRLPAGLQGQGVQHREGRLHVLQGVVSVGRPHPEPAGGVGQLGERRDLVIRPSRTRKGLPPSWRRSTWSTAVLGRGAPRLLQQAAVILDVQAITRAARRNRVATSG